MSDTRKAAHTPGWEVHQFGDFTSFEIHEAGDENGTQVLGDIREDCIGTPAEKEARANLWASAPELLAVLEEMYQAATNVPTMEYWRNRAGTALAAAKGEKL